MVMQIDSYSVFYDNGKMTHTELHELLSKRGITTLYVVGLATDYCVYYSAKDASALGTPHFSLSPNILVAPIHRNVWGSEPKRRSIYP